MDGSSNFRNPLGVMQGRLLPKYNDRYQAHPVGYWQAEFAKSADLGLDCIEFILDFNDSEKNPLLSDSGVDEILRIAEETGVQVHGVCADYFMEAPLHHLDPEVVKESQSILTRLLSHGEKLGLRDIVIPCVDQSSLADQATTDRFVDHLVPLIETAVSSEINLSLETDLPPQPFAELLARFDSSHVTVNYDTGNSASLGFDPIEELSCYGDRITDIHIKDRVCGGGSVVLGTGDAQFTTFFETLRAFNFTGPFILQAYRDDEGEKIFEQQLEWVNAHLTPWLSMENI
jgi:L-ribulose-5-phosphate 3-epimerase